MTCHSTLPGPDRPKAAGLAVVAPSVDRGTRRRGDSPLLLLRIAVLLHRLRAVIDSNAAELAALAIIVAGLAIAYLTGGTPA